jgi:quinol monooxygenase YgiN
MIVEYIRYRIAPDRADAFVAAYGTAAASLRASPVCLGYELARCTEAPEQFILRIEWQSVEAHLEGFRKSPQFPPFLEAVRPYLGDIEEMRHYELTAVKGGTAAR